MSASDVGLFSRFGRWLRDAAGQPSLDGTVKLREGDTLLASVKDGVVIAHTFDVALSHAEFVRRYLGVLPEGGWVGTIRKFGPAVIAVNSRTFYGNQLPAPQTVIDAVRTKFR
jgi:hypothetical protein